jgi:hypothetical protein
MNSSSRDPTLDKRLLGLRLRIDHHGMDASSCSWGWWESCKINLTYVGHTSSAGSLAMAIVREKAASEMERS